MARPTGLVPATRPLPRLRLMPLTLLLLLLLRGLRLMRVTPPLPGLALVPAVPPPPGQRRWCRCRLGLCAMLQRPVPTGG